MEINWNTIEGYSDDLSAENKLALLEKYQPELQDSNEPDEDNSNSENKLNNNSSENDVTKKKEKFIAKGLFDKVASELAKTKKELRAKMSEEEAKEHDRQQEQESMTLELESLRKEKTLSTYKASFLSLGYDEQLAFEAAEALSEGDMDAVFDNMKKHITKVEKDLRAKILKETPVPPAGNNSEGAKTKDEEIYQKLYGEKG